ncbi:MAG: YciI family protein [Thermoflexibacter sp.]|nr:YciI family protein [Thermoflexibacter sp.]
MKDFMLLFRDSLSAEEQFANASPEEMQAEMAKWTNWMEELAAQGKLIGGEPLLPSGKVLRGTSKKVTDGAFMEGKELVGGFLLIKASDWEEAVAVSKGCPTLDNETGTVEVREIMKVEA